MTLKLSYQLMKSTEVQSTLERLAGEILKANADRQVVLVGIHRRGVPMAQRMASTIAAMTQTEPQLGVLDINLYRDDLSTVPTQPVIQSTEIHFPINDMTIVLVDDVLYTGRTVRAAMEALLDYGRPKAIQLCALIDRGHRELPIQANYVGKSVQTTANETVEVKVAEIDQTEGVLLVEKVHEM